MVSKKKHIAVEEIGEEFEKLNPHLVELPGKRKRSKRGINHPFYLLNQWASDLTIQAILKSSVPNIQKIEVLSVHEDGTFNEIAVENSEKGCIFQGKELNKIYYK